MTKIKFPTGTIGPQFTKKILPWVEQYWFSCGRYPSDAELIERFGFTQLEVEKIHASKFYKECLKDRGIRPPSSSLHFTEKQNAAITIMSNVHDTRNTANKLAAIGVTPQMYNGWMHDPAFKSELQRRVDDVLDHIYPDAQAALAKQVKNGRMDAIRFYYEITGRAVTPETVNVRAMMVRVIEAVQKHVKDPAVLSAIAEEIKSAERASVAQVKPELPSQPSTIKAMYQEHLNAQS